MRLNASQRKALRELIHDGAAPREAARYGNRGRAEWLWLGVLALMFVVGALTLFEGTVSVRTADMHGSVDKSQPRVDMSIVRLPSVDATTSATDHSSVAANRTM